MRFRKSVRLCKGLRLNFSGSGVSMSLGVRGASVSIGKKGTYLNYGIPGTGLYNRVKISGNSSSTKTRKTHSSIEPNESKYSCNIYIDERGQTSLEVKDMFGNLITNSSIISRIRRSEEYKTNLEKIIAQKKDDINSQTLSLIQIHKLSEIAVDFNAIKESYVNLLNQPSPETLFEITQPQKEEIREQLIIEAKRQINSILFWTNSKKREEFVADKLQTYYEQAVLKWETQKKEFVESKLAARESKINSLEKVLQTDIDGIYAAIDEVLQNISLPVEFFVNYEINNRILYIDLDLPEIEDMPFEKVTTLASGRINIKQKTIKEQSADYALCVCGMSYFLTSLLFNTTPEIDDVHISAFTQRENKKTGRTEDQYVYSVRFDRTRFSKLDFNSINPIDTIYQFPHNINITQSYKLETIDISQPLCEEGTRPQIEVPKPSKKFQENISIETNIISSVEQSIKLLNPFTKNEVNVVIPRGSILVEVQQDDKTIFCLDSETYLNLEEYVDELDRKYIVVKKDKWQEAVAENTRREECGRELAITAELNNQGIALEKDGKIDEAIDIYEQNVSRKCNARHSYDRLLVLYKKKKDDVNELRIAKIAASLFPNELKYKKRLEGLIGGNSLEANYPTQAIAYSSSVRHGDIFEARILNLPEFDFYHGGTSSNANLVNSKVLEPIWEIQRYFKNLIETAELAESKKDFENAAMIYEQIVGENYWMPAPYDRLIKIYAKAKLKEDEVRIVAYAIKHFSKLREKRLGYVKTLAEKYSATDFLNERIQNGGKITYYNGVFELYNPFNIIEKWEERLRKIKA